MSDTLDQLRRQFATPCPTLAAVREQYFAHIRTCLLYTSDAADE